MANTYKTPGVYVEEISKLPPSVADVATAIPAFISYTEAQPKDYVANAPIRISSLLEYESLFGKGPALSVSPSKTLEKKEFVLYDSLRLFYDNGGGICYILSIGLTKSAPAPSAESFTNAIAELEKVDEVTLLLFPDAATCLTADDLATVQQQALLHCRNMGDRFAILDVKEVKIFRDKIGTEGLAYGAAYYPYLQNVYTKTFDFESVLNKLGKKLTDFNLEKPTDIPKPTEKLMAPSSPEPKKEADNPELSALWKAYKENKASWEAYDAGQREIAAYELHIKALIPTIEDYTDAVKALNVEANTIPPSGAIAGVIASVDNRMGVWTAPANISLASVSGVSTFITDRDQEDLNVDPVAGKSINAIRPFTGKGILVWGARTLAGNDNEWRYVSVRRLFNYVEESVQKSTAWAVFSPNDGNTWIKIKSQIENFLNNLWRQGALAGSTPDAAYYVNVGLNITMTAQDILEGRLIVEIGMAAVRPAEFIILRFSHKLQE